MSDLPRVPADRRDKGKTRVEHRQGILSPAPRPSGSPTRGKKAENVVSSRRSSKPLTLGAGRCVVLYLHSPRERHWGFLLSMDTAGLWLRGIELESFDAWAREQILDEPGHMGLTTFFVPYLRVDKVTLDERVGPVPSLKERFEAIVGRAPDGILTQ